MAGIWDRFKEAVGISNKGDPEVQINKPGSQAWKEEEKRDWKRTTEAPTQTKEVNNFKSYAEGKYSDKDPQVQKKEHDPARNKIDRVKSDEKLKLDRTDVNIATIQAETRKHAFPGAGDIQASKPTADLPLTLPPQFGGPPTDLPPAFTPEMQKQFEASQPQLQNLETKHNPQLSQLQELSNQHIEPKTELTKTELPKRELKTLSNVKKEENNVVQESNKDKTQQSNVKNLTNFFEKLSAKTVETNDATTNSKGLGPEERKAIKETRGVMKNEREKMHNQDKTKIDKPSPTPNGHNRG